MKDLSKDLVLEFLILVGSTFILVNISSKVGDPRLIIGTDLYYIPHTPYFCGFKIFGWCIFLILLGVFIKDLTKTLK